MKLCLLAILPLILLYGATPACQMQGEITKEQAITLAQKFLVDNGYTTQPANNSTLSYELFDQLKKNVDTILSRRYNTLQPKAFCISEDKGRWDIGFLFTDVDPGKLDEKQRNSDLPGRAVIVMKNGKEIRMAHKDPLFSHFRKI